MTPLPADMNAETLLRLRALELANGSPDVKPENRAWLASMYFLFLSD